MGEFRDRSFENQRYRASGVNLVVAAIVLWNTVYLERAVRVLRDSGKDVDAKLLPRLSPLGREHINLTGNYADDRRSIFVPALFNAAFRSKSVFLVLLPLQRGWHRLCCNRSWPLCHR